MRTQGELSRHKRATENLIKQESSIISRSKGKDGGYVSNRTEDTFFPSYLSGHHCLYSNIHGLDLNQEPLGNLMEKFLFKTI